MQTIYLIRHAMPNIPPGQRVCLGRTDLPLGTLGRLQSVVLGEYMKTKPLSAVYCSPLVRAVQTVRCITENTETVCGLEEMDAGDWDGLSFEEIQIRWPEIYRQRGIDPNYPIPGAEDLQAGQQRFLSAVREILGQQEGDFAIVAHKTVIQSFISYVLKTDVYQCRHNRLDYTGITTVQYQDGEFSMGRINEVPMMPLTDELCDKLLKTAGAPAAHCHEVAAKAMEIVRELAAVGIPMDADAVRFGALLHDIARAEKNHPEVGGQWLQALGWQEIGEIVRFHHDPQNTDINEQNIVFLADKLPVEERFSASLKKCDTPEAIAAHQRRYRAAVELKEKINALCGKEIIP